jgi:hypothetical protein
MRSRLRSLTIYLLIAAAAALLALATLSPRSVPQPALYVVLAAGLAVLLLGLLWMLDVLPTGRRRE